MHPLRWLARNLSMLFLALLLAVAVWILAVVTTDPNEVHYSRMIDIQVLNRDDNLLMHEDISQQARLTLQAPRSIWERINSNPNLIKVWVDLHDLGPGPQSPHVQAKIDASPIRIIQIVPDVVNIELEQLLKKQAPVDIIFSGTLPIGYERSDVSIEPRQGSISGPKSLVERVVKLRGQIDLTGVTESIQRTVTLEALDENSQVINDVDITPREASVHMPISLQGGYKNAAVKVITKGQVSNGYRLTNILVSPPTVTLFSDNQQVIEKIPGYVETLPIDISNLVDDIELSVNLNLPEGASLVRDSKVVVQVGIAALEGSLTLSVPIEMTGLPAGLQAIPSPATIDVLVSGPLNILDRLTPSSLRVVLDLSDLKPGIYQHKVRVENPPTDVTVDTILPEMVEVTISAILPTPTTGAASNHQASPTPKATHTPYP